MNKRELALRAALLSAAALTSVIPGVARTEDLRGLFPVDFGTRIVLAGQAIDIGTGATDPSPLDDGGPSTRSRHVPRQELTARATAKDRDFKSFRPRHVFLRRILSCSVT